jgi:hypothetical protein
VSLVLGDVELDANVLLSWPPINTKGIIDVPFVEGELFHFEGGVIIFKFY